MKYNQNHVRVYLINIVNNYHIW